MSWKNLDVICVSSSVNSDLQGTYVNTQRAVNAWDSSHAVILAIGTVTVSFVNRSVITRRCRFSSRVLSKGTGKSNATYSRGRGGENFQWCSYLTRFDAFNGARYTLKCVWLTICRHGRPAVRTLKGIVHAPSYWMTWHAVFVCQYNFPVSDLMWYDDLAFRRTIPYQNDRLGIYLEHHWITFLKVLEDFSARLVCTFWR